MAPSEDHGPGYKVALEAFSGPLDLLLYLIREQEVEITDIPIAEITDQYLQHIEVLQAINVNLAGEFLEMAATLMEIKSRMLLPRHEEAEEEEDPRADLIRQLIEYKKFKDAARTLGQRAAEQARKLPRGAAAALALPEREPEDDLPMLIGDLSVWDLLAAFKTILKQTSLDTSRRLVLDHKPVAAYCNELLRLLAQRATATFGELFEPGTDRATIIGTFLALLELIRRRRLRAEQAGTRDAIRIVLVDATPLSEAEVAAAETTAAEPVAIEPPAESAARPPKRRVRHPTYRPSIRREPGAPDELTAVAEAIDRIVVPDIQAETQDTGPQASTEAGPAARQGAPATHPGATAVPRVSRRRDRPLSLLGQLRRRGRRASLAVGVKAPRRRHVRPAVVLAVPPPVPRVSAPPAPRRRRLPRSLLARLIPRRGPRRCPAVGVVPRRRRLPRLKVAAPTFPPLPGGAPAPKARHRRRRAVSLLARLIPRRGPRPCPAVGVVPRRRALPRPRIGAPTRVLAAKAPARARLRYRRPVCLLARLVRRKQARPARAVGVVARRQLAARPTSRPASPRPAAPASPPPLPPPLPAVPPRREGVVRRLLRGLWQALVQLWRMLARKT